MPGQEEHLPGKVDSEYKWQYVTQTLDMSENIGVQ